MRVVLIGSVNSTRVTLTKLLQHGIDIVAVLGLESDNNRRVSGYISLQQQAEESGVPFHGFTKINEQAATIIALKPDLIFVVGLSQLVSQQIIDSATHGCVGFHPTKLPQGRGRAPLGWLTLDQGEGAATFFKIADGIDDGPIYVQQSFFVDVNDDASGVSKKIQLAIERALDIWLPQLAVGNLEAVAQNHEIATYNGIRKPEDGWLNWQLGASEILRVIRSAAKPHPGSYTYCGAEKIIIWKAVEDRQIDYRGVVGRILYVGTENQFIVQTGSGGLLRVLEYEIESQSEWSPKVGSLLGYYDEAEIYDLKSQVRVLVDRVAELEKLLT